MDYYGLISTVTLTTITNSDAKQNILCSFTVANGLAQQQLDVNGSLFTFEEGNAEA